MSDTSAPEVIVKSTPTVRIFGVREMIETYQACKPLWDKGDAFMKANGMIVDGPCFSIFYDPGYKEKDVDMEACFQTTEDSPVPPMLDATMRVCELPGIEKAATLVHRGDFRNLKESYDRLFAWIGQNKIQVVGPVREVSACEEAPETMASVFGSSTMNLLGAFTRAAKREHISGRAQRGLFAGRDKAFGNNVSFSKRKTRRAWKVNHQWKQLYSEALDEKVGLNVTTHTLRCIDKAGGLDNYLLSIKKEQDLGIKGLQARNRILEALQQVESQTAAAEASA
ncbi:TPA: hypothetical protein N0F65_007652 [Lagenidium giganteum]|uniref:Large ribosomal subunit protein bL28m n=1 Tax=Lagenidium giganteum TaxID=4803 RepID=A0AAV2Z6B8_9STRA|nr:TPA: hypothetical protein N0F65_007652 [Lagenidium giganteum]